MTWSLQLWQKEDECLSGLEKDNYRIYVLAKHSVVVFDLGGWGVATILSSTCESCPKSLRMVAMCSNVL